MIKLGLPEADAAIVAGLTDGSGHSGLGRARCQPVAAICPPHPHAAGFNVRPNIHIVLRARPVPLLLSGDNGMGHLVMSRAAEIAIEKSPRHRPRLGQFAIQQPCRPRLCSMPAMPLAHDHDRALFRGRQHANHLPPWGGLDMLLSTGLITAAIPARQREPGRSSTWPPQLRPTARSKPRRFAR